ncbi:Uncharacterized protein OBRU01_21978, partial [Operophtera brumata]
GAARFNCKGRILGAYYADAKSGCKAFHVCVRVAGGGIRDFRFFCPPGTLFHQEAQTCTDWGDDDPLACPADLYDGQFDLYKIGSGFDTKKASIGNREEEAEFGLQRAETGDRRLTQNNNNAVNAQSNDLRAAHSSDFFSGQRDRGRDEPAQQQAQTARTAPPPPPRQSFRRATTPRSPSPTTQHPTNPPSQPQPTFQPQYEVSKRKLVRKRPVYVSSPAPQSTFSQNNPQAQEQPQPFQEPQQQNQNRRPTQSQNRQLPTTTPYVPPQYKEYKDEYVEVSRVTPKPNRYYPANPTPLPSSHATSPSQYNNNNKKDGLTELYNYEAQSTPGLSNNQDKFKEKNNFVAFSKQNYNNPTTIHSTSTYYTTYKPDPPQTLNTVAYDTNNGFHSQSNFAEPSEEDDGQYRPPRGEEDGQYRPELYGDRELLSGAHSLNIAASGNRLPEDQKQKSYAKTKASAKVVSQTAAPRPFRPAPTPSSPPQTSRAPEPTYTTTAVPQTQRTFDLFQTYTTTFRPTDYTGGAPDFVPINNAPVSRPTTTAPRVSETHPPRPQTRPAQAPTFPPNPAPRPTTQPPNFSKPANKKEDNSYDYAYYDSDNGFSEYDHIEEFGRTKKRA